MADVQFKGVKWGARETITILRKSMFKNDEPTLSTLSKEYLSKEIMDKT